MVEEVRAVALCDVVGMNVVMEGVFEPLVFSVIEVVGTLVMDVDEVSVRVATWVVDVLGVLV